MNIRELASSRLAALTGILALPALLVMISGISGENFGMGGLQESLAAVMRTSAGKILFSPFIVLGGLLIGLILNLWATCQIRIGLDTGTVYITFWVARAPLRLIFNLVLLLLLALLLTYGFVENFKVVPK